MRLRHKSVEKPPVPITGEPGDDDRAALLERSAALLAAADDAISRTLSRDSTEFLARNRQSGGE